MKKCGVEQMETQNANEFLLSELRKFRSEYEVACREWGKLCERASVYRDFIERDLSVYLNEKLMPVMFSNIVKKHEVIMNLEDNYVLVATPKGFRYKWHSSSHSTNLHLYMLKDLFMKNYDVVEKWFSENLNRKRVAVLKQFKEAFVKDFNPLWARKRSYDDNEETGFIEIKIPVKRDFFFINKADSNGTDIKENYFVEDVILRMDVSKGEVLMAFVTNDFESGELKQLRRSSYGSHNDLNKFIMWEDNDFLSMFSFREIMSEVLQAITLANERLGKEELAIQNWFVGLKQNLSAYVSLITL
jgi:hypothetical protein